jgi:hypothetical protein
MQDCPDYERIEDTLVIQKATADVSLDGLSATYDGTSKYVYPTSSPGGLNITVTCDGASLVPTDAGSYPVEATINDPNYEGLTSGTLEIAKGTASDSLDGLSVIYDGSPKSASASTTPSELNVTLTNDGSSVAPTN